MIKKILIAFACLFSTPAHSETPQRIVSVGGGLTEIIYALGMEGQLVGTDTTSYFPSAASELPKVGYLRSLSPEGILSLAPDVVVLSEDAGPSKVIKQLEATKLNIERFVSARTLKQVKDNIHRLGVLLGQEDRAAALLLQLAQEEKELRKIVGLQKKSTRVLFVRDHISGTPIVAGRDTPVDGIISLSGAQNVAEGFSGYKSLTPEVAVALQPDVILTTSQEIENENRADALLRKPGLSLTPAARNRRIVAMDTLLLIGFGPRTVKAALELNSQLQKYAQ